MSKVKSRRRRLHNGNIASIHDVYCLIEIMRLYGVSESTPANWVKQGLVRVSGTASFLVRGEELNRFHAERKKRSKQPLAAHQFFCLTCHAPSEPAPGTLSGAEPDHRDIWLQTAKACVEPAKAIPDAVTVGKMHSGEPAARMMTAADVAAYLRMSVSRVWRLEDCEGDFPRPVRIAKSTRWDRQAIDHYLDSLQAGMHSGR